MTPTDRLAPSRARHLLPPSLLQGYFEASGWGASSFLESTKDFYDLYNLQDWRSFAVPRHQNTEDFIMREPGAAA